MRLLCRELLRSEEDLLQLVRQRMNEAAAYRRLLVQGTDAYRLVFSEADRLPGLFVDQFNDVATIQILTQAWDRPGRKELIIDAVGELTQSKHIVERTDERIRQLEQLPPQPSHILCGNNSASILAMNGPRFHSHARTGQTTAALPAHP